MELHYQSNILDVSKGVNCLFGKFGLTGQHVIAIGVASLGNLNAPYSSMNHLMFFISLSIDMWFS